jgi:hypothetical protein
MMLHAKVNEDGTLSANIPEMLWGKKIVIFLTHEEELETTHWDNISELFKEADALDFPRKYHAEILRELRTFKETE